jgi:hypothetical protein
MSLADRLAETAHETAVAGSYLHGLRLQIAADATAAVLLLIVNTVLSVYKPRGMTLYGRRKQRSSSVANVNVHELNEAPNTPRWVRAFGITAFILLLTFRLVLRHFSGGSGTTATEGQKS